LIRLLTPWPALLLEEEERVLLVSDLHMGFEYELAKMGISIPYQSDRFLKELLTIVNQCKPQRLIVVGDLKHGIPVASFRERREIPEFFDSLKEQVEAVEVVRGNHDGGLQDLVPKDVKIHSSKGLLIGEEFKVGIFHGHAWPSPRVMEADLFVTGHNHPTVLLRTPLGIRLSRRIWAQGTCEGKRLAAAYLESEGKAAGEGPLEQFEGFHKVKVRNPKMVLMPAFNDLLGGLPINSEAPKRLLGPLLRTGAVETSDFEVYLLDGTFLGKVDFLRTLA